MQKLITTILLAAAITASHAQQRHVIIPGKGHIDVEKLNKQIDLTQDISKLNISETRVLRNAFAARQGYCFMSADLRSIFSATSWYDSIMNQRYWDDEAYEYNSTGQIAKPKPIGYTRGELRFIKQLEEHEKELRKKNFQAKNGWRVNVDNLINPFQMDSIPASLYQALGINGFAIVPYKTDQLFQVYENNDYHYFPNFITTDLFLQAFHTYFDCILRDLETQHFHSLLQDLCNRTYESLSQTINLTPKNKKSVAAAKYLQAYFAIALRLLDGKDMPDVSTEYRQMAADEVAHVEQESNTFSRFLDYQKVPFAYSLFRPRGHYTRSEQLKRYFKAMMWLQTVPFGTDKREQMERAVVLATTLHGDYRLRSLYDKIFLPLTFLMGHPDNVTIMQLADMVQQTGLPTESLLKNSKKMKELTARVEELSERQTLIRPRFEFSSRHKINFMPQRYQPDALVLQEMIDYENQPTLRAVPRGLDVLAALGISEAERILLEELNEDKRWDKYTTNLQRMKTAMNTTDWGASMAHRWIASLKDVTTQTPDMPYFMTTPQWAKKNLNTALASWTQLKHDAILYAKQPIAAECGDGGPPEPTVKSYVEPNVSYWKKAIELLDKTLEIIKTHDLTTEKIITSTNSLREQAEFLLRISEKELAGKAVTDEEYDMMRHIGSTFEYITLWLIKDKDGYLSSWDEVNGADKKVSLVADVMTSNGENNPAPSVLYEAIGPTHRIYVVVEMGGYLYLTRGAVLSYREFQEDVNTPRLTDEEWQKQLETDPHKGIPSWMNEIILLDTDDELDNEYIFFSTGC